MGIMVTKVRIKNFRSIESLSIDLGISNLLIGQNNTGKSNFLRALNTAIGGTADVSEDDIFIADDERLEKSKSAVIDIMLQPIKSDGTVLKDFSDFWTSVFTDTWITPDSDGSFVGIRTEIKYDVIRDSYGITRHCIRQWKDSIESAIIENKKSAYNEDMRASLQSFYMDANRDIVQDIRNRKSYFGRVTSSYEMPVDKVQEIETQLTNVNAMIIQSIPSLQQAKERISAIGKTIGADSSIVEIEPLARKISDLNKGMDIVMQDGKAASFPISQHGSGIRSWVSFLTLSAFVEIQNEKIMVDDEEAEQYIMLTMEEPEAHLHPQAQRQLFSQISRFTGQKVVSTHSPSIVSQCALADAIYFSKRDGKTTAIRYKSSVEDDNQDEMIFREVINTRADLLFASAVVLCEGITEELALPIYFYKCFGCAPYSLGVSIISTGGQKYLPYLSLIKNFNIPWFIFSDGEAQAISIVKSAVNTVFNVDYLTLPNVVVLDHGDDYETYLINEGYKNQIIEAICEHEDDTSYLDAYICQRQGKKRREKVAKKLNKDVVRDYTMASGRDDALIDLWLENKVEYALPVARKIVAHPNKTKRIPTKVAALFSSLAAQIGVNPVVVQEVTE